LAIEEELILRAKALDIEALDKVADYLMRRLPTALKIQFPDLPYDDVKDATMAVLEKFLEDSMSIRAKNLNSLFAWAKMVGKNYLIDLTRLSESNNLSLFSVDQDGNEIELPIIDDRVREEISQTEHRVLISCTLQAALDTLSLTDKCIIYDYYLDDRPLEAIAKDLKMTIDAVKQRKRRALHKVREILNSQGITYNSIH
jgi:RNA polymerase sigma factor (sigma-70 family)